jgi:ABC-type transporter Mla subunit MlaD
MDPSIGDAKRQIQTGIGFSTEEYGILQAIGQEVDDVLPSAVAASNSYADMTGSQRWLEAELGRTLESSTDVVDKVNEIAATIGALVTGLADAQGFSRNVRDDAKAAHGFIASTPEPTQQIARQTVLAEEKASSATASYNQAVGDQREPTLSSFAHQRSYDGLSNVTNSLATQTGNLRDRAAELSAAAENQIRAYDATNVEANALLAAATELLARAKALEATLARNKSDSEVVGAFVDELRPAFGQIPTVLSDVKGVTTYLAREATAVINIATAVDGAL